MVKRAARSGDKEQGLSSRDMLLSNSFIRFSNSIRTANIVACKKILSAFKQPSMSTLLYILLLSVHLLSVRAQNASSPFEEYVFAGDPLYSWTDLRHSFVGATNHGAYTAHVINMTSGSFLNASIVDHVIWWHHIVVIVPNPRSGSLASTEKAFFWTACADAGSNSHPSTLPNAEDLVS